MPAFTLNVKGKHTSDITKLINTYLSPKDIIHVMNLKQSFYVLIIALRVEF